MTLEEPVSITEHISDTQALQCQQSSELVTLEHEKPLQCQQPSQLVTLEHEKPLQCQQLAELATLEGSSVNNRAN